MRGIHRWPVNYPHKGPVTRKKFPFDDVIVSQFLWLFMTSKPRVFSMALLSRRSQYYVMHLLCQGLVLMSYQVFYRKIWQILEGASLVRGVFQSFKNLTFSQSDMKLLILQVPILYVRDPIFVITVLADVLEPRGTRPPGGTALWRLQRLSCFLWNCSGYCRFGVTVGLKIRLFHSPNLVAVRLSVCNATITVTS